MLTRKKGIVSCFVAGALLCTMTSWKADGNLAVNMSLTAKAAQAHQDFEAEAKDIRKTSKAEFGNSFLSLDTLVARLARIPAKDEAAESKETAENEKPVTTSAAKETEAVSLPETKATAESAVPQMGQTQENAAVQPVETAPVIAPELENKVITTVETYQNIRKEPSEESEIVGRLEVGSAGDMLETKDGWTKIVSGEVEGWVHNEYVVSGEAAQTFAEESLEQVAVVKEDGIRVRDGASIDATWIGVVNADETYPVVDETEETEAAAEENTETVPAEESAAVPTAAEEAASSDGLDWVKIVYDGENEGYVCTDYVNTEFELGQARTMEEIRAEEEAKAQAEREAKEAEERKAAQAAKEAAEEEEAETEAAEETAAAEEADSGWVSLGEFKITAYCGGACCNGKWAGTTATGASPAEGRTIAVAPWVIPYGTQVKIDGLDNIYVAEDTGGFANRNPYQIDLFIADHGRTGNWGVRYREVWVKR